MRTGEELRAEVEELRARVGGTEEERALRAERRRLLARERARAWNAKRCSLCGAGDGTDGQEVPGANVWPCVECGRPARAARVRAHWLLRKLKPTVDEKGRPSGDEWTTSNLVLLVQRMAEDRGERAPGRATIYATLRCDPHFEYEPPEAPFEPGWWSWVE